MNPYERLGISPDASFDDVQAAKRGRLGETKTGSFTWSK